MGDSADANAAFVATMEDVLEVYQRPHDPQSSDRSQVRWDQSTCVLADN